MMLLPFRFDGVIPIIPSLHATLQTLESGIIVNLVVCSQKINKKMSI
jgi:hypothetical protein